MKIISPFAPCVYQRDWVLFYREMKDRVAESDAACGLGQVYQQMADYSTALRYHEADLETAEELKLPILQGRACGNLGSVYESLGNLQAAIKYQEQHLSIAAQTNDQLAKTVAYSSLGEIHTHTWLVSKLNFSNSFYLLGGIQDVFITQ